MRTLPSLMSVHRSIFVAMRDAFAICLPFWSFTTNPSTMKWFKNPRSMRPTRTFVPSFSVSAFATCVPTKCCTEGRCNNIIISKYSPIAVHTLQRIKILSFFKASAKLQFFHCILKLMIQKVSKVPKNYYICTLN